jgi:hypothetical protein
MKLSRTKRVEHSSFSGSPFLVVSVPNSPFEFCWGRQRLSTTSPWMVWTQDASDRKVLWSSVEPADTESEARKIIARRIRFQREVQTCARESQARQSVTTGE